jgi:hypothetical protein
MKERDMLVQYVEGVQQLVEYLTTLALLGCRQLHHQVGQRIAARTVLH